jgi:hypothetical protein
MKILLDSNAKVGREAIFIVTVVNKRLDKTINDDGVG